MVDFPVFDSDDLEDMQTRLATHVQVETGSSQRLDKSEIYGGF